MIKNYESTLKEIIKEYNLKPKKKLGQNFLHDKNIISSIIRKAKVENENIIEIGPGPGILTKNILKEKAKSLLVIEKDKSFEDNLKKIKNDYQENFDYLIDDILDFKKTSSKDLLLDFKNNQLNRVTYVELIKKNKLDQFKSGVSLFDLINLNEISDSVELVRQESFVYLEAARNDFNQLCKMMSVSKISKAKMAINLLLQQLGSRIN